MVDTQWFSAQMKKANLNQRKLAKEMQLRPPALSRLLSGKRKARSEEVQAFGRLFGVSADEVLSRLTAGQSPNSSGERRARVSFTSVGQGKMALEIDAIVSEEAGYKIIELMRAR